MYFVAVLLQLIYNKISQVIYFKKQRKTIHLIYLFTNHQ